jgi:hypothetical protein
MEQEIVTEHQSLWSYRMKEPRHLDDSPLPPFPSESNLTAEQREALAKVYRFLLALQDKKTNKDESKNQTSPESTRSTDELVKSAAQLSAE